MSGGEAPAPIFDSFFIGCAIFAALFTAADWLLSGSHKDSIKYSLLSVKYYLEQHSSTQIANRAFSQTTKAVEVVVGAKFFGRRRATFYGVLVILSYPAFVTLQVRAGGWEQIYGTSGWAAFSLLFWIQISLMLWMLRTKKKDSVFLFCFNTAIKIIISLVVSTTVFFLCIKIIRVLFPLFAILLGNPEISFDSPREDIKGLGNNEIALILAFYYAIVKLKTFVCLLCIYIRILIAILSTVFLFLLKFILAVFGTPLQIVFDRMVVSDKGVLTQLGIGLAAAAKIAQEAHKYLAHNY